MNRYLSLFGSFILLSVAIFGQSHQYDWKVVHSEEFHFIASFPDQPKQTTGDIELSFGKGVSKSWTLKLPEIEYEIVVAKFPDLSVEMEDKALLAFYKSACADFGVASACRTAACAGPDGMITCQGYYTDDLFGVSGLAGGFRGFGDSGVFAMYLIKSRLYFTRATTRENRFKDYWGDIKKFKDGFLFAHVSGTEGKFKWGLPESESQNRKGSN